MNSTAVPQRWLDLTKRLAENLANQNDRSDTVNDNEFIDICRESIEIIGPIIPKVERDLPFAKRISKLPSQLKQCISYGGKIPKELALDTSIGILSAVSTFFKKDAEFDLPAFSFPKISASADILCETITLHVYRVELA